MAIIPAMNYLDISTRRRIYSTPLFKGQALWSLQEILPLKEDNPSITVKLAGLKVSVIQRFHCIIL